MYIGRMYPDVFVATIVVTSVAVFLYVLIYFTRPVILVKVFVRLALTFSGMRIKYVNIDGLRICYGEKGYKKKGKSSILLLHGFSADKCMWVPLVKNLPKDLHVIALDLPGHGDSDMPTDAEDLSLSGQVERLHEIIKAIGMDEEPFHLVGLSLGGTLAGLYSIDFPDIVERVTLMCPVMITPVTTPVAMKIIEIVESGNENLMLEECPLIPKTPEEIQYLFEFTHFHKFSFIPKQILHAIIEMRKPYNDFYFRLFRSFASLEGSQILENNAHRITVPTQLVWGEEDQMVHVSGAEVLRQKLPNCQSVYMIPRCGHVIHLDRPGSKTKALLDFRGELKHRKKPS